MNKGLLTCALLPYTIALAILSFAPGYLIALETHRVIVYGVVVWHLIGVAIIAKAEQTKSKLLAFFVFVLPAVIMPIAGPFAICCFQGCGLTRIK
jgi:FtsH-binding integral membrane protein